jgi:hypothetical protein
MRRKKVSLLYRLRKGRRGQSMAMYAIITASMLVFGSVFAMKILPDMLDAYNNFAASMYFSINMPIP